MMNATPDGWPVTFAVPESLQVSPGFSRTSIWAHVSKREPVVGSYAKRVNQAKWACDDPTFRRMSWTWTSAMPTCGESGTIPTSVTRTSTDGRRSRIAPAPMLKTTAAEIARTRTMRRCWASIDSHEYASSIESYVSPRETWTRSGRTASWGRAGLRRTRGLAGRRNMLTIRLYGVRHLTDLLESSASVRPSAG